MLNYIQWKTTHSDRVNLEKRSLSMDTEIGGKKRFETRQEQSSQRQKQNTWQKDKMHKERKTASARHKKKSNRRCNVTFGSTVVN